MFSPPTSAVSTLSPLATTCSFQIEFNQDQIHGKSGCSPVCLLITSTSRSIYGGTCTLVVDQPIDTNISSEVCFAL